MTWPLLCSSFKAIRLLLPLLSPQAKYSALQGQWCSLGCSRLVLPLFRPENRALATLTSAGRNRLANSQFVFPGTRAYPIPDAAHARNALARVAQNGTPKEMHAVRRAVKHKFPGIGKSPA
jgi:hypothetical protein